MSPPVHARVPCLWQAGVTGVRRESSRLGGDSFDLLLAPSSRGEPLTFAPIIAFCTASAVPGSYSITVSVWAQIEEETISQGAVLATRRGAAMSAAGPGRLWLRLCRASGAVRSCPHRQGRR